MIIGIIIYVNQKPAGTDHKDKVTDAPTVQETERLSTSLETASPAITPTPTRLVYHITNPPTEAPTPIPPTATPNPWRETEYPPTCEEAGYIVRENTVEGYTVIEEGKPALGHEHGAWQQDPEKEMYTTTCIRCGKEIKQRVPYDGTIPRIDLNGSMEGISKTDRVTLQFDFASPLESFSCYAYTSWQGHNSLKYPKKNYTIRLYDNKEITEKHKLIFRDWVREHKYVLKANYRDFSQARNLIAADLWADMAASRPNLYEKLQYTSNYGAVDGFPVIAYLNGEFIGLYTMNLHIDDDLYQMNHDYDAILISNSVSPDETRFRALATFEDEKNAWEVEYCGTQDDNQWAKDKLNELISFVMHSDNETFREHLKDYLDVDGAIDYLLFIYALGLQDNAAKDLVLLKYHDCNVWIPTVYDMEHAFGLNEDGSAYLNANDFLPSHQDGIWDSGTKSLLWDRLLQLFEREVCARYSDLRQSIFDENSLKSRVDIYMDEIPEEYFEKDLSVWPRKLPDSDPQGQMKTYIEQRIEILDSLFM